MKKVIVYLTSILLVVSIFTFSTTSNNRALAKSYSAVDRDLKSLKLQTSNGFDGYRFTVKYPGKSTKNVSTVFKDTEIDKAVVKVMHRANQPTLIFCIYDHHGWPYVEKIYAIKNGKFTKVKISGEVGAQTVRYVSNNKLITTYYNRFLNIEYTYISKYNRKTNTLKTVY